MKASVVLLACVSCVVALPAYILPYGSGRGASWVRRILDCPPLYYGTYGSYRCRQEERRAPQGLEEMTVLEIVEEEPGHITVVEDEIAGPFAIKVPHHFKLDKPRCTPNEVYISELDICVDGEGHVVKHKATDIKPEAQKQKVDKKEPVTVLEVGHYEKEKCGPGEIWVPEVAICMDRNPPPPLEPEDWTDKPQRRKKTGY